MCLAAGPGLSFVNRIQPAAENRSGQRGGCDFHERGRQPADTKPRVEDDPAMRGSQHARSNVPVIITTGDRGDEIDRAAGLELGAFALPSNRPDLSRWTSEKARRGLHGLRQVNVVPPAILHPSTRHGPDAQVWRDFRPAHGGDFPATLQG